MAHNFSRPSHTNNSPTKFIFQASINTLNSATFVIAYCFGRFMPDQPTAFLFSH